MITNTDPVVNYMNKTNIKHFKIIGLFGRYDIDIPFNKVANIFIGENGLGKTTILNCIYYVLEKKFSQLEDVMFDSIEIMFKDAKHPISITKGDLIAYNLRNSSHEFERDADYLEDLLTEMGMPIDILFDMNENMFDILLRRYIILRDIPRSIASRRLSALINSYRKNNDNKTMNGDARKVYTLSKQLNYYINERIIYLPTYRRIENDITNFNLRNEERNASEMSIRFGMGDVQKHIDSILDQIRTIAVQGYNKMTGLLLKQYAKSELIECSENPLDVDIVKIMLDRLGDKIENEVKSNIIALINDGTISDRSHLYLSNLLHNLIDTYDQQKYYDDCINKFADTCNKYLNDKRFYYDKSKLTLGIYFNNVDHNIDTQDASPLKLTQLSSGEKQVVSLFSKLYLEDKTKSIIIIDEPELSLSLHWQEMLLPDIIRSENCNLLLTVTHSPFIFDNEFDMDAMEMRAYMSLH